jgi:hyperosmotically inducible periplasmic protein
MKLSNKLSKIFLLSSASVLLGVSLSAMPVPSQEPGQPPPDNTRPDNSRTNRRDRDRSAPTADRQKMSATDREVARKIRAAIHEDKSLSTYAHNIKIISRDGRVTLRGPVRSAEEKTTIESKATEIAGAGNVTNELEVAPPKS